MSAEKHTPGEWDVIADGKVVRARYRHYDQDVSTYVADIHDHNSGYLANARLIAAAPDLLARVKARRADCVCDDLPLGEAVCPDCHADAEAIAKAEGR